MGKKEKNTELVVKKQQKQFTIVYVVGLFLFILLMFILEGNGFRKNEKPELNLNLKLLETPKVLNNDKTKERGIALENITVSYDKFENEINSLNLISLSNDKFEYLDDSFKYVNENYTHIASDNSLKLSRKGKEVYSIVIEENITKIKLTTESTYYLEYSQNEISFKIDNETYSIIKNDKFIIEHTYEMDGYDVVKEVYDSNWNFVNIEVNYNNNLYTGYFFDQINGYSLSEDKMQIVNDNNLEETIPSTKMNEDNQTIYYTILEYHINPSIIKDMLLVNNNNVFPLK